MNESLGLGAEAAERTRLVSYPDASVFWTVSLTHPYQGGDMIPCQMMSR